MRKFLLIAAVLPLLAPGTPVKELRAEKTADARIERALAGAMREVVVPRLNAPSPDGAGWEKAYVNRSFTSTHFTATAKAKGLQASGEWRKFLPQTLTPSQPTELRIGFDDKNLYLRLICFEKMMERTAAEPTGKRDGAVYAADSIDVVLSPHRNGAVYYQLVSDLAGNRYDSRCRAENGAFRSDTGWNPETTVKTFRRADRWELFMAIPFREFAPALKEGEFIDLNVNRQELPFQELSSWNPVDRSFHELDRLVRVHLGRKSPDGDSKLQGVVYDTPKFGRNRFTVTFSPGTATLLFRVKGGESVFEKRIPASASPAEVDWPAGKAGKYTVELALLAGEKKIDSASFVVEVPNPLELSLRTLEIPAGSRSVPAEIRTRLRPAEDYELFLSLAGKTFRHALGKGDRLSFELDVSEVKKNTELRVELRKRGDAQSKITESRTLSRGGDPFEEE